MNEFLELASYDWLLSEPQGENVYEDIALAGALHCEISRVPLTTLMLLLMPRFRFSLADGLNRLPQVCVRELHEPALAAGRDGLHVQLPAPRQVHHEHHHGRGRQGGE